MSTEKVRGIILKETFVGEADKMVTILAKGKGKMSFSAKGARKPNSRYMAGTQMFSYCDFVLYAGRNFYSVTQIEIISSFYHLRSDLERLTYASYFAELVLKTMQENLPQDPVLLLLLKTLNRMEKGRDSLMLAQAVFELKLLDDMGLAPLLDRCSVCGISQEAESLFFSEHSGGVVCPHHKIPKIKLMNAVKKAMVYILSSDLNSLYRFHLSPQGIIQLNQVVNRYLQTHVDVSTHSLRYLSEIK